MVQQAFAGIFNQVEHVLETIVPAIVGVRYDSSVMMAAEFGQPS